MVCSGLVLHDAPSVPMSGHSSAHQMPGRPRGPRCCSPACRGFYLDPSREPQRDVDGRLAGDRGGRVAPRDFAGGDGWPVASGAGAPRVGRVHRSTRAPGNTGDTPRTAFRNHRRGNVAERKGLARCPAPGPAGRTGHGHPSRDKVTVSSGEPVFLGPPQKPRSLLTVGVSFFRLRNQQPTPTSRRAFGADDAGPLSRREFRKLRFLASAYNVAVGTVKKSIAARTSRWLRRKLRHRCRASGSDGCLGIIRETVRSETSKPSMRSSP